MAFERKYGTEVKSFAKDMWLVLDDNGMHKYTHVRILQEIKDKFGVEVTERALREWCFIWKPALQEVKVLQAAASGELVDGKKYALDKNDKKILRRAIVDQLRIALVANTTRFKRYVELEQMFINNCLSSKANNAGSATFGKDITLKDLQSGIKGSNDAFLSTVRWLKDMQDLSEVKYNQLVEAHKDSVWEFEPVDILTFIESKKFLNLKGKLYKVVVDDLKEIFYGNPRSFKWRYNEVIFKEAFSTGKSERASIISVYMAYLVLCLRNPAQYFGLLPGSKITITNVSVNASQAKKVVFGKIKAKVDNCAWFREHGYMYDPISKSELRFEPCDNKIVKGKIYKNVYIVPGNSSQYSAVGYDVICGIIDEATAYPKVGNEDQAEVIYGAFKDRIVSRFAKSGMLVMAGNPRHVQDFLERRLRETVNNDKVYKIPERSIWDAKYPDWKDEVFYFDRNNLKIVDKEKRHEGNVYAIPVIFKENFEVNPEKSARDLGGWALESITRFVSNTDKIKDIFADRKNPVEVVDRCDVTFSNWFRPITDGWHSIHIDLGVTNDAAAICLTHISDVKNGRPFFWVDCIIRLEGSKTNPIIFDKIRTIIYQIQSRKFAIKIVTLDGFQSTDMIQILRQKGFKADLLSVDKTILPYGNLRNVIYESRINCPHDEVLERELTDLENINNRKVDHPFRGSKDVSDALCGSVNSLLETVPVCVFDDTQTDSESELGVKGNKEVSDDSVRSNTDVIESMVNDQFGV